MRYNKFKIPNNPHISEFYTIFQRDCPKNFDFSGESHNFWELVCVISGKIGVTADSKVFSLTKGQAILHSPMQFHRIYNENDSVSQAIIFSFDGYNIPDCTDMLCPVAVSDVSELYHLAKKSFEFDNLNVVSAVDDSSMRYLFFTKKFELFLLELKKNSLPNQNISTRSAENYATIINTLNKNIDRRLSVSEIAALCRMSEINVKKTFSKYAGTGIIDYFTSLKMKKASELLKNDFSVKETAIFLGYDDQNYFSTVFKRVMGKTPSDIKKGFQKT